MAINLANIIFEMMIKSLPQNIEELICLSDYILHFIPNPS